jgi:6-phosphogluconolactonase (cycloisomerase 2 family)
MSKTGRVNALLFAVIAISIVSFQNCQSGFHSGSLEGGNKVDSSTIDPGAAPAETPGSNTALPTTNPSPSPTQSSAPGPTKTHIYFGRAGGIEILQLDHAKSQVISLGSVPFDGSSAGWLAFDEKAKLIFAPDAGVTNRLQIYNYNVNNGALTSRKVFSNFTNAVVHLALVSSANGFNLFGASYNNGLLGYYRINAGLTQGDPIQNVGFASGALTHSSSFDSKRNLLYIANLGLNRISVYQVTSTGMTALKEISLTSPRTVVYDQAFDKLFVSTESSSGPSYIRIYSIEAAGNSYNFSESGALAMPMIASDLKVNHRYRYVMSTAREAGKESIWGLPVTENGTMDASRKSFSIAISQKMPRALEITQDGSFLILASQVADNIQAYKMSFDAGLNYISSQKIFDQKIGTQGFLCGLSIPVP